MRDQNAFNREGRVAKTVTTTPKDRSAPMAKKPSAAAANRGATNNRPQQLGPRALAGVKKKAEQKAHQQAKRRAKRQAQKQAHKQIQNAAAAKPAPKPAPQTTPPKPTSPSAPAPIPAPTPPAAPARVKKRHWGIMSSFLIFVMLPAAIVGWYLWERAVDQYASTVGFSVRKEEVGSAIELLGGITELSGSSSSDTDILYEFIQSQKLVADIDAILDLRALWSKPENDPIFAYEAPGTIEDLMIHWDNMVRIYYDSGTQLIEVRTLAFSAEDATAIATAIYDQSSKMINALSNIAREDSIRYARVDLDQAENRLRSARTAITEFRNRTQIVDPTVDLATQAGLLGNLQAQLAEALIEENLLKETTRTGDPRLDQAARRVRVIEGIITQERRKLGIGSGANQGDVFATLMGEYERLAADREFAERSYTGALATYDAAQAEARRQSRYLAAHVFPTKAEQSLFPQRLMLLGLFTMFLFLAWAISVLMAYSLRDRR